MSGEIGQAAYLALLLVALSGYLIVEWRRRPGQTTRALLAWGLIFVAAMAAAALWPVVSGRSIPAQSNPSAGRIEVPLGRDGHFHLIAQINDVPVRFVVDTGASALALTRADAKRAGLDPDALIFAGRAMTANGPVDTASVRLASVAIGDIRDSQVAATVLRSDLDTSLMGMDYLRRFARVTFAPDRLVLER